MNELAKMIADALMTNSEGEVADRLVLEKSIGGGRIKELGGRNRSSVEQTILQVLLESRACDI